MKRLAQFLIKGFSKFVAWLPIPVQFFVGDLIGLLWFDILRIRRKVILSNLKLCFPDWTDKERIRIGRRSVCHLGRSFVEFLRMPGIDNLEWKKRFNIEGVEHLNKALEKGKGVCLLTAHVGNGDWGTLGLVLNGIIVHIISKDFKLQWLNDFWYETRRSLGTEFISDRGSSLKILKLLKKNQIIVFVLDQFLGPPIGVKTRFFGHETGTGMGLAVLAGRSEAPVVPVHTFRLGSGQTQIVFEPEIPFVVSEDKDETIVNMTQIYCNKIEGWIRSVPEQWMWVHRRWKRFKH